MNERIPTKALVFDLGDVLLTWSANTTTSIPGKTLRKMLETDAWADYDCGLISQSECYSRLATQFNIPKSEVTSAFAQAFESLKPNQEVVRDIQDTKQACKSIKVLAMSNMPKDFYDMLASRINAWAVFNHVFTSGYSGVRKPHPDFYRHVLQSAQMRPEEVLFFDDREDNIAAAHALNMRACHFTENRIVTEALTRLRDDPFERGHRFLAESRGRFDSITSSGVTVADNFALLLIQETGLIDGLVEARWDQKATWNFFIDEPVLVPGNKFPDDLDTTSLALMVVPPDAATVASVLDHMLEFVHSNGVFQTYFDRSKPRTDEIVSANVLACFYHFNRGHELPQTLEMVHQTLLERTYIDGTRYYPRADCCLYFIARLLRSSSDACLHAKIELILKTRLEERLGQKGSAIELAMRILACSSLGIVCRDEVGSLLEWQQDDGSWPASWMYQYGSTRVKLGNSGVTTAMAIKAIATVKAS